MLRPRNGARRSARAREFVGNGEYAQWLSIDNVDFPATDEDLIKKFRVNAAEALPAEKIDRAIDKIMGLEAVGTGASVLEELVR